MNKNLTEQANRNKSWPEKVYIKHFQSRCWWIKNITMYKGYNVKLINNKKRNSKYCNKTLSITDFEINK